MILNCFDHALIISADINAERYLNTVSRLLQVGINAERLQAILPIDQGCYPSIGKRGCAESHLAAIKLARKRNYRNILIFEDDIILQKEFLYNWNKIYKQLQVIDYDIFYFYRWREAGRSAENIQIVPIHHTLCAHAYAINSKFYEQYIAIFEQEAELCTGSSADRRFTSDNAKLYAPTYNLIGQDANISTITGQPKGIRYQDRFEDGMK
jgi:GR25 family glycosyltransferase involved in LPS biosynthesis